MRQILIPNYGHPAQKMPAYILLKGFTQTLGTWVYSATNPYICAISIYNTIFKVSPSQYKRNR
jgi:hypothetical protein